MAGWRYSARTPDGCNQHPHRRGRRDVWIGRGQPAQRGGAGLCHQPGRRDWVRGLTAGDGIAVLGEAPGSNGTGIYGIAPVTGTVGIATDTQGTTFGVYGLSAAQVGVGVYGIASNTGDKNYGVYGRSNWSMGTVYTAMLPARMAIRLACLERVLQIVALVCGVWPMPRMVIQ